MFCKCNFYLWYLQNWNHYFDRKLKLQLIKTHKKNFFTKVQKPFQNQTVNAVIFWHQKTNKSKLYLVYLKYLDAIESRKWLVWRGEIYVLSLIKSRVLNYFPTYFCRIWWQNLTTQGSHNVPGILFTASNFVCTPSVFYMPDLY